jgi:hypothetical protein
VAAREVAHLRLPIGVVDGKFMQENNRCPASRFLEIETDIIAGDGIGHLTHPLVGPAAKIAVNAVGRNEAKSACFVTE